jgi:hypothetical protein
MMQRPRFASLLPLTLSLAALAGCGGSNDAIRSGATDPSGNVDATSMKSIGPTIALSGPIGQVVGLAASPCITDKDPVPAPSGTFDASCVFPDATGKVDYSQSANYGISGASAELDATLHDVCYAGICLDGTFSNDSELVGKDVRQVTNTDANLTQGSFKAHVHMGLVSDGPANVAAAVAVDEGGDTFTFAGGGVGAMVTGANGAFTCTFTDEHGTKGSCKGKTSFSF